MSDRLGRALQALRDAQDGSSAGAEETLARVLDGLRSARARSSRRLRVAMLAAAVLAISTAAAAAGGRLGPLVHALRWRSQGDVPAVRNAPSAPPARPAPTAPETPSPAPGTAADEGVHPLAALRSGVDQGPAEPGTSGPAPRLPSTPSPSTWRARPQATPRTSAPVASTATPPTASAEGSASGEPAARPLAPSPDDEMYAHAHRLHFGGASPSAALSAWDDYLRAFPEGRFAPEARYNRAIDLLKLQRYAEARQALLPFASGAYGFYHRDEAVSLLHAIP